MPRARVPHKLRQSVTDRAGGCCEYCRSQMRFAPERFSVEHIKPVYLGGLTIASNLALSCQGCNNHKAKLIALDPITGLPVALFNPRIQSWSEHFTWSSDYTVVDGMTPCGRATIIQLKLDRPGLINIRRVLFALGEHPPVLLNQEPSQ